MTYGETGMDMMMHAGLEFQGALTPDMERAMAMKTEVLDNEKELMAFLDRTVNSIVNATSEGSNYSGESGSGIATDKANPNIVKEIDFFGESGSGKGLYLGQIAARDAKSSALYQAYAAAGKEGGLMQSYSTTADGLTTGMTRNISQGNNPYITSEWGRFTNNEFAYGTELLVRANDAASWLLPQQHPDYGHRLYRESVGILSSPNIGNTILDQASQNPNAAIVLVVTNPDIQAIAYDQRWRLWHDTQNIAEIEKASNTKFDIPDAERLKATMGNPFVMQKLCYRMNDDLYNAYLNGELDLNDAPQEVFQFRDPRKMNDEDAKEYFHTLTRFTGPKLTTVDARPHILKLHLENKKREIEKNEGAKVHIFKPKLMTLKKVNSYPGYLRDHVLPVASYASLAA